jgi:hypothetical protein
MSHLRAAGLHHGPPASPRPITPGTTASGRGVAGDGRGPLPIPATPSGSMSWIADRGSPDRPAPELASSLRSRWPTPVEDVDSSLRVHARRAAPRQVATLNRIAAANSKHPLADLLAQLPSASSSGEHSAVSVPSPRALGKCRPNTTHPRSTPEPPDAYGNPIDDPHAVPLGRCLPVVVGATVAPYVRARPRCPGPPDAGSVRSCAPAWPHQ